MARATGAGRRVSAGPPRTLRTGEGEAVLERLGLGLARLYDEPDAAAGREHRFFAASGRSLPPGIAAAVRQVSQDAASGSLLPRLSNPRTSLGAVVDLVAANPVLAGNVLKIANSPLYGLRAEIAAVEQAVAVVGLGNVRALVFAELLERAEVPGGPTRPARGAMWAHMAKTAVLARRIAPAFAGLDAGVAYTAGLLHDVGKLTLPAAGQSAAPWRPPAELAAYGVHHGLAGYAVCGGFDLPGNLSQAVCLHHAPSWVEIEDLEAGLADIRLALAVGMADTLALSLDGCDPGRLLPLCHSYRFLINEPILAEALADPALAVELSRATALVRVSRS
ncbi:HDOD domain-containing protein [Desulfovibrio sp. TomC]|uniref:HDOD domain-containing protein n=1 Tax=Desulfovibrio sp. TomC TaxID=1562888 RepID=UPI0018CF105A|nr:HDOD domain-containing protein [Desulfovibrio sp. TomC]